ncbi:hypothetical protein ACHAQH_007199 [Verticillium albo-atrum]
MHTATSLGDTPTDPWGEAWARNALKVGLVHHFVLHLAMGLAGFHLAYSNPQDPDRQAFYVSVARTHVSSGLAEVARALPNCDESNCGAIYLASLLVSYCSYAAGPSGPNDLFACAVGEDQSQLRPPLITGTRLLRESYQHKTLFSGLMAPFGPASHFPADTRPTYLCHGFPRIDWVGPFEELRELVSSQDSPNFAVYDQTVDGLEVIYDATYGRGDDVYDGEQANKIIFGWLYRMDDSFRACLQRKERVALLILAHFAVLLRTKPFWFLDGWEEHLLDRIAELTDDFNAHNDEDERLDTLQATLEPFSTISLFKSATQLSSLTTAAQLPARSGLYGFDPFRDVDGNPVYPQPQLVLSITLAISTYTSGGGSHTGNTTEKIIAINNLLIANASRGTQPGVAPRRSICLSPAHVQLPHLAWQLVEVTGIYEQALRDLSAWVEEGNMALGMASDKQPVVTLGKDDEQRMQVSVGEAVSVA